MSRLSHAEARRVFRWEDTLQALGWSAGAPVDLARTIVDRHAASHRTALRWVGKAGASRTLGFAELGQLSAQVAGWLRSQGVRAGDRVAGFLPRVPETIAIMPARVAARSGSPPANGVTTPRMIPARAESGPSTRMRLGPNSA